MLVNLHLSAEASRLWHCWWWTIQQHCSMIEPCTAHAPTTTIHHITTLWSQTCAFSAVAWTPNWIIRLQFNNTHATV